MGAAASLLQSTVGKKVVMAATGLVMVGWLTIHMVGNLLVFAGQEAFNHYAEFIQSGFGVEPGLLWALRAFMLGALMAHIWSAVALRQVINAARPVPYAAGQRWQRATPYGRMMLVGGVVLAVYIVFHLLHLTVGLFSDDFVQHATFERGNAYKNLVVGLQNPAVGLIYVLASLTIGAHLHHGTESAFQTLGVANPSWDGVKKAIGTWLPVLIAGGNLLIVTAVLTGLGVESPR
jgi:succinate dehydrogenase / fumarate reductase cytochrome b subunit